MQFYNEHATTYAASTFGEAFAEEIYRGMKAFLPTEKTKPILDIGCGSGRDAHHLTNKGFTVDAYDLSPEMIQEAQKLTGLDIFQIGSAQNFKSDKTYDFAYSIACLLHLNDDEFKMALINIFAHLNDGGSFYFMVKKGQGEEVDGMNRYFNYFTVEKILSICDELGFKAIYNNEVADLTRPDTTWLQIVLKK